MRHKPFLHLCYEASYILRLIITRYAHYYISPANSFGNHIYLSSHALVKQLYFKMVVTGEFIVFKIICKFLKCLYA